MTILERKRGNLRATPPFDFTKSLDYLRQFPPPALDLAVDDDSFLKAFRVQGQTLLSRVCNGGIAGETSLKYVIFSDKEVSKDLEPVFLDRLQSFLSLDDDLRQFYSMAE